MINTTEDLRRSTIPNKITKDDKKEKDNLEEKEDERRDIREQSKKNKDPEDHDHGRGNTNKDQGQDHYPCVSVTYALSETQIRRIGQAEKNKMLNDHIP